MGCDATGCKSVGHLVRAAHVTPVEDSAVALDLGLAALRRLSERTACVRGETWEPKPEQVKLSVGQIFRHKKWGFRGVVVDWYDGCPADARWQETHGPFEEGVEQPFYRTLVDTRDRPNPFMSIAAQENLEPLEGETVPVSHPLESEVFSGFECGRHVMTEDYEAKFPEDA